MEKRRFIATTSLDMGITDTAAVSMLIREVMTRSCELCALLIDTPYRTAPQAIYRLFEAEGAHIVPIGINKTDKTVMQVPSYYKEIKMRGTRRINERPECHDAVRLMRKTLAEGEYGFELLELGSLRVLQLALASVPDDISPLSGYELFCKKVSRIWIAGGSWAMGGSGDFAFSKDELARRAAADAFIFCPCPIYLVGNELGRGISFGTKLRESDYLYRIRQYCQREDFNYATRVMLLACAFIDNPKLLELNLTRGYASVDPHDGRSYFIPDKMSNHYFFSRVHISDYYGYLFQTTI